MGAIDVELKAVQSGEEVGAYIKQSYVSKKASVTIPQTTQVAYFKVNGGRIKVLGIYGRVTTVIQTAANAAKLVSNPTVGADVDLCATLDITAQAVGTMDRITGTLADAMVAAVSGAHPQQLVPVIVAAGTIDFSCAASKTGAMEWILEWEPLDPGSSVSVV